jgi:hypothetical protein
MGLLLQRLQQHPLFQYRITPRDKATWSDGVTSTLLSTDAMVNFVGFLTPPGTKKAALYHYPLDPITFGRASITDLYPDKGEDQIQKLFRWGMEIRLWCRKQRLHVKPSAGGLAAQLLRDPRFYPEPRRKVPRLINSIARTQLPGNYYHLNADTTRTYHQATYLDMENAHHAMAQRIRFPDGNSLHAYGQWGGNDTPYTRGTSLLLDRPGLFRVRLLVPNIPGSAFPPPYLHRAGDVTTWLFSNELGTLREFGATVTAVYCALTSDTHETGLNQYARFAINELRREKQFRPWLKPTLHATYGILAARPLPFETGFYRSTGGRPGEYHLGRQSLPVNIHGDPTPRESKIANVIHRGMIEAEVRKEVLETARLLTADGRKVLCIYADSLIVQGTDDLKLMLSPWRVKETLTELRFYDSTHFTSREMIRLPGIARDRPEIRRARIEKIADSVYTDLTGRNPVTPLSHEGQLPIGRHHAPSKDHAGHPHGAGERR